MRSARRPTRAKTLVALAAAAAAACGSDSIGDPILISPAAGTYALQTVNGNQVPAAVQLGSKVITFLADTLRLSGDGSYTEFTVTETSSPGQAPAKRDTLRLGGRWADNGTSIGIENRGGAILSGGNTISLTSTVSDTASQTSVTVTQVYVR